MSEPDEDSGTTGATIDSDEDEMAKTIISDDDIEVWKSRRTAIDTQIAALNEERVLLDTAIESWSSLQLLKAGKTQPDELRHKEEDFSPQKAQEGEMRLTDAIRAVLKKYGKPMKPGDIKDHIKDVGFTRPFGKNYFYTCIGKAADKGLISRRRDGRYMFAGGYSNGNGTDRGT
jgi:hypothetical protein